MPAGQFCGPCWKCRTDFWLPQSLYEAAKKSAHISFFCPYGHEAVFSERDTEADKLRRERDRLKQQLAQRDDEIAAARHGWNEAAKEANALKASAKKVNKRIAAGVCPCCHRTVRAMALHMKNMHPQFVASEVH